MASEVAPVYLNSTTHAASKSMQLRHGSVAQDTGRCEIRYKTRCGFLPGVVGSCRQCSLAGR